MANFMEWLTIAFFMLCFTTDNILLFGSLLLVATILFILGYKYFGSWNQETGDRRVQRSLEERIEEMLETDKFEPRYFGGTKTDWEEERKRVSRPSGSLIYPKRCLKPPYNPVYPAICIQCRRRCVFAGRYWRNKRGSTPLCLESWIYQGVYESEPHTTRREE
jgi:hypothetical protein